ncbi:MAG: DUF2809 domain-containing protein [Hyphomicrobiaceae bacterium]|nr:DUF2809 domain-containing protein [Hyphomicrobiaceae bacterium]
MKQRNRLLYLILVSGVVLLGLASRQFSELPAFVHSYVGDVLWALMVFLLAGFLLPRRTTLQLALAALCFSFLIEFSQLYHAPWIDALRHNRLGGLVLGFVFVWSDLLSYAIGIAIGALTEQSLGKLFSNPPQPS